MGFPLTIGAFPSLQGYNASDYCLVEVSQFVQSDVEERVMRDDECPLRQLEDLKEVSCPCTQLPP